MKEKQAREILEQQGCRILDRLMPRESYGDLDPGEETGVLVLLDTETTGLHVDRDEVIQLAMIKLTYGKASGRLGRVIDVFDRFREPAVPISPEITALTGITDAMVAGQKIDEQEVSIFLRDAALIIAHNAAFDRPFAEKHWPIFDSLGWACSYSEVDWRAEGFEGSKLAYLLMKIGLWHEGHRALDDVWALAEILSRPLLRSSQQALEALLTHARRRVFRVWAVDAPFESRLLLKGRGYRWSSGEQGTPRAWHREVPGEELDAEQAFLVAECLTPRSSLRVVPLPPRNRFSARALMG
ncbi:3'-5' exonuclease [Lacibacterium aquatile]|uniref:3'-5' exonuclease n=1 Tax=Lacibacterium aquatile TaxID=1168082 RepID=A0ABW5DQM2_9PROT